AQRKHRSCQYRPAHQRSAPWEGIVKALFRSRSRNWTLGSRARPSSGGFAYVLPEKVSDHVELRNRFKFAGDKYPALCPLSQLGFTLTDRRKDLRPTLLELFASRVTN